MQTRISMIVCPQKGGGANRSNCEEWGVRILWVSIMQVMFKQEAFQVILQTLLVKAGTTEQLLQILLGSFRKWRFIKVPTTPQILPSCVDLLPPAGYAGETLTHTVFLIFVLYPSCKKISSKCIAHFNTVSASVCSLLRHRYVGNSEANKVNDGLRLLPKNSHLISKVLANRVIENFGR